MPYSSSSPLSSSLSWSIWVKWAYVVPVVVDEDMFVETLTLAKLVFVLFLLLGEVVEQNFFVDDVLELFFVEVILLELELDWRDRLAARLGEKKVPRRPPDAV